MWNKKIRFAGAFLMLFILTYVAHGAYVGPEKCRTCHPEKYEQWRNTLHAKAIMDAADAIAAGYPVPEGVDKDDLKYTWPGKWKVRWVNKSGYVITGDAVQYNVVEKKFVSYEAGQIIGYDCAAACHTTDYNKEGTMFQGQNAVKSGTWSIPGITCERCHGQGDEHIKAPSKGNIKVNRTSELCSDCHGRTDASINLMKKDLDPRRRHREQYNDFYQSNKYKAGIGCIDCHNSHDTTDALYADLGKKFDKDTLANMKPAKVAYYKGTDSNMGTNDYEAAPDVCGRCHVDTSSRYPDATKVKLQHGGANCLDCHMAKSRRNAIAWDERSHTFMVDDKFNYSMAKPYSNYPDLTCRPCHADMDFSKVSLSSNLHSVAKAEEETPATPGATAAPTPAFEALFAIAALLTALLVRRR